MLYVLLNNRLFRIIFSLQRHIVGFGFGSLTTVLFFFILKGSPMQYGSYDDFSTILAKLSTKLNVIGMLISLQDQDMLSIFKFKKLMI